MHLVIENGLTLWKFKGLENCAGINHFVTGRNAQQDAEFTLSYSSSPNRAEIRNNRSKLASAMGVADDRLLFPSQVHETQIVRVTSETAVAALQRTDALITNENGLCIAVMAADCVPILLYDSKNKAIAAIHSGWRGTAARILEKTMHEMRSQFGTRGADLIAGIGPSVSQASYEVGQEVIQAIDLAFGKNHKLTVPLFNGKARLDLWKANIIQLLEFGVELSHIEISSLCTVKENDHFFSARKGDTGRFAAGIMLTAEPV